MTAVVHLHDATTPQRSACGTLWISLRGRNRARFTYDPDKATCRLCRRDLPRRPGSASSYEQIGWVEAHPGGFSAIIEGGQGLGRRMVPVYVRVSR